MNADDLDAAAAVLARHEGALMALPGVFGAGVGSAADHGGPDVPCLVILASGQPAPGAVPAQLEGLPVFVVTSVPPQQQGV